MQARTGLTLTPYPGSPRRRGRELHQQLSIDGLNLIEHADDDRVQRLVAQIDRWDIDETTRQAEARAIMRTWSHVNLQRHESDESLWRGRQQWQWNAQLQALTHREVLTAHKVSTRAFHRFTLAMATDARRDGLYMAGLENTARAARLSPSQFYACLAAAQQLGLVRRQFAGRLLDQYERGVVITAGLGHLTRWRSVYQLEHPPRLVRLRESESPRSGPLRGRYFRSICFSTDLRPVDGRASRVTGAASRPKPPQSSGQGSWRWLDARTVVLHRRLQRLSETWKRSSLGRTYPHLLKFAQRGATATALIQAIDDEHLRAGRSTPRRVHDPDRWLIACLNRLLPDDVMP